MSQKNRTAPDKKEVDTSTCRVRKISDDLMECLVEKDCPHALPFGNGKFCRHPLKHQIPNQHH